MNVSLDTLLRLLEIVSLVGGGIFIAFKFGRATARIELSIVTQKELSDAQNKAIEKWQGEMKEEIKKIGDILGELAVQAERMRGQDERLNMLRRDMEDLRRGHGFIVSTPSFPYPSESESPRG